MRRRILLVGATGAFGERLARMIAPWEGVELVLAARRAEPLQTLAAALPGPATIAVFDRDAPDLSALRPWAVVDLAGPFQTSDLRLAEAAIAAGAHYVDIADGRDFVASFPAALDAAAQAASVLAVTGASSTPALSNAALEAITSRLVGDR
jgi:saccharopine dehydrogenase-like NADP-dependent oxidoreductase